MPETPTSEAEVELARAISDPSARAGLGPMALTNRLVGHGVSAPEARRAIQTALETGALQLGPALKLYPAEDAA